MQYTLVLILCTVFCADLIMLLNVLVLIYKKTISTNIILAIMRIENVLVPMYNTVTRSRK